MPLNIAQIDEVLAVHQTWGGGNRKVPILCCDCGWREKAQQFCTTIGDREKMRAHVAAAIYKAMKEADHASNLPQALEELLQQHTPDFVPEKGHIITGRGKCSCGGAVADGVTAYRLIWQRHMEEVFAAAWPCLQAQALLAELQKWLLCVRQDAAISGDLLLIQYRRRLESRIAALEKEAQ